MKCKTFRNTAAAAVSAAAVLITVKVLKKALKRKAKKKLRNEAGEVLRETGRLAAEGIAEAGRSIAEKTSNYTEFQRDVSAIGSCSDMIYIVNIIDDTYVEYSNPYDNPEGEIKTDFFNKVQEHIMKTVFPEDRPKMCRELEKERFLSEVQEGEVYSITYRLLIENKPVYFGIRAIRSISRPELIVLGVTNIDASKRREALYEKTPAENIAPVTRDALTEVKNKLAYSNYEKDINEKIEKGEAEKFAVVFCDVNGLNAVNEEMGMNVGDAFLKNACSDICLKFKHSPVFRIGGDEFAVILRGEDYNNRKNLIRSLRGQMTHRMAEGKASSACGTADFDPAADKTLADILSRADEDMKHNKEKMVKK